jgi:ABC-type nitrate/sulfonate/bicarbonate transport system permease component
MLGFLALRAIILIPLALLARRMGHQAFVWVIPLAVLVVEVVATIVVLGHRLPRGGAAPLDWFETLFAPAWVIFLLVYRPRAMPRMVTSHGR